MDILQIQSIAVAADMFSIEDVGFLGEQFLASQRGESEGAKWLVVENEKDAVAATFFAPEPFSDRM